MRGRQGKRGEATTVRWEDNKPDRLVIAPNLNSSNALIQVFYRSLLL